MKFREMDRPQKRRFYITFFSYVAVFLCVLAYFTVTLYQERLHCRDNWDNHLRDDAEQAALAQSLSAGAVPITVGTYVENLRELNLRSSYFRVEFLVWFDWEGDADLNPAEHFRVYKGLVNDKTLLAEEHEGDSHYQLVSMDVSVSKDFDTKRFPLESHQLRFYVESTRPIQEVVFTPDYENSGLNRDISISGYEFMRHDIGAVSYLYGSTHGDPTLLGQQEMSSEIITALEINRASMGMYFKCFIALGGTVTWVLIALFICTYHHVDPLGMIPGALFGTVSNIMIGANLLPDALEMGLLEYVNLWGVLTILGSAIAIIIINRVRKGKDGKTQQYAHFYGRMLFYTMLVFAVAGQVIMPLAAYAH